MSQNLIPLTDNEYLVTAIKDLQKQVEQLKYNQSPSSVTIGAAGGNQVIITPDAGGGYFSVKNSSGTEIGRITIGSAGGLYYISLFNSQIGSVSEVAIYNDQMVLSSGAAIINVNSGGGGSAFITLVSDTSVIGNFSATGTKAFDIPHPDETENKRLRYIAIESPEVLVVCRGVGEFNAQDLPKHFTLVSEPDTLQVVQGINPLTNQPSWIATAVRKGYLDFEPEYLQEPVQQPGN